MKPYVRELEPFYHKSDILELLGNDEEIFKKLRINKIINKNDGYYNFHYVGVIVVDDIVLYVYPKYIPNEDNIEKDFKEVLKVINKYNRVHEDFDNRDNDLEDISMYIMSLMLFFIEDYYENGVYHNIKHILQTNGNGEINWNRTVNDTFPIIINNKPYYTELQTNDKIDNLFNYFRLLHEYIITKCSKDMEKFGLLKMFDLTPVELSDRELEDFGGIDYILNRLRMELNVEFNTYKRKLLKSMHDYLTQLNSFSNDKLLTLYGTGAYHEIWEEMCAQVFDNKLDTKIIDLDLGFESKPCLKNELSDLDIDCESTLINIIKKPTWIFDGFSVDKDTFIPDLISIDSENKLFMIFDAKYYNLDIDKKKTLKHQPGLSSITKQYLYELAYKDLINTIEFSSRNAFLFPKYDGEAKNIGCVELEILHDLYLKNIQLIMLPAYKVNQHYLDNTSIEISELNLKKDCDKNSFTSFSKE